MDNKKCWPPSGGKDFSTAGSVFRVCYDIYWPNQPIEKYNYMWVVAPDFVAAVKTAHTALMKYSPKEAIPCVTDITLMGAAVIYESV